MPLCTATLDHWYSRGHVLFVLDGKLITEISDGKKFKLTLGTGYRVTDEINPNGSCAEKGAKLFTVSETIFRSRNAISHFTAPQIKW